ncbi:MAG: hypothetical protein SGBAC_011554 [Bacillariaceae sp.]
MTVPFKKRRIVCPKHMEQTPEPATSSTVTADVFKSNACTASSNSKRSLSCERSDEQVPIVDTNVTPTIIEDNQQAFTRPTMMKIFETCESESEAAQVIRSFRELFKKESHNQRRTQTLAHSFVHLNAVPTILKAMTQWKQSLQFVSLSTDVLKILLFYVPRSRKSMFQLDGTRILIEACEEHWFLPMVKAALAALSNVAASLARDPVVIEECLFFVEKAMKVFDADAQIQRLGTYFCLKIAASVAMSQGYKIPLKKRCIDLAHHREATPEAFTSSVTADAVKSNIHITASNSRRHLSRECSDKQVMIINDQASIAIVRSCTIIPVLETCESESEAEQAIYSIRELFKKESQHKHWIQSLAQAFVRVNAVPIILKAMNQWKDSLQFTSLATDVLKIFLFYVPSSRKSLLQLDGTRILIEACEEHWYLPMVKAALAALSNAAPSLTRDAVVIEECLSFVEKAMKVFDADAQIQRLGTYFCLKLAASVAMSQGYQVQMGSPDAVTSTSNSGHASKRKLDA